MAFYVQLYLIPFPLELLIFLCTKYLKTNKERLQTIGMKDILHFQRKTPCLVCKHQGFLQGGMNPH